jgi:dienelactone hydrolase
MKFKLLCATALVVAGSAGAQAQTAQPQGQPMTSAAAAKAFGAREYVGDISLSPDGTKVAIVAPSATRGEYLQIADFASGKPPATVMQTSGNPERLSSCRWVSNTRMICTLFIIDKGLQGVNLGFTRLIAIDADGKNLKMVSERTSNLATGINQSGGTVIDLTGDGSGGGSVMLVRAFIPDVGVGTNLASSKEGVGVDLVDTLKLTRKIVESPRLLVDGYITDGVGHIRLMSSLASGTNGYMGKTLSYGYRKVGERDFRPLGVLKLGVLNGMGLEAVAVDPKLDAAYAFDDENGHRALVRIKLDGSMSREVVVADPRYDVDDVIQVGRQRRVVGASWGAEQRSTIYFDPELKALAASLGRALPKQPLVNFKDATADEKQLLLSAASDNIPGRYYLFDKTSRKLEEVMPIRPQLEGVALAQMKPITFKAADGTTIPGYLTLPPGSTGKNLPAIVMPHGGPAARDEWGFDWLAQFFANRGYAVLQPNYRGSAGYGEGWFQKNGFQSWRTAIGDIDDGARWLVSQGIAAQGKLAIVGWSYGGYAALQAGVTEPDLYKAVIAIAGIGDLDQLRNEARRFTNFPFVDRQIGSGPHVADGSPARHADRMKAPVLMFHGDIDLNVDIAESRLMASRLRGAGKQVELVEFKGLDHQLEDSAARAQMLEKSDAFLRGAMGM